MNIRPPKESSHIFINASILLAINFLVILFVLCHITVLRTDSNSNDLFDTVTAQHWWLNMFPGFPRNARVNKIPGELSGELPQTGFNPIEYQASLRTFKVIG